MKTLIHYNIKYFSSPYKPPQTPNRSLSLQSSFILITCFILLRLDLLSHFYYCSCESLFFRKPSVHPLSKVYPSILICVSLFIYFYTSLFFSPILVAPLHKPVQCVNMIIDIKPYMSMSFLSHHAHKYLITYIYIK